MSGYELRDIRTTDDDEQQQDEQNLENRRRNDNVQPDVIIIDHSSSTAINQSNGQPNDKYYLVFFILLIHGIGTLMPWNMFINAQKYFTDYKLAPETFNVSDINSVNGNSDVDELAELRKNFLSYLGLAAQVPNVIFNGLNLIVNMGSGNLKLRVNLTLLVELMIFLITIILAIVDSSKWPITFFYVTMVTVVILNMASGIYQNCIFGTGAKFPGIYTNAILIGSNFSGTFTSIINLLSIWLAPKPQEAAIYYFVTALFVLLICTISYNLLPYNLFFKFFDRASQQTNVLEIEESYPEDESTRNRRDDVPESLKNVVDAMIPRPQSSTTTDTIRNSSFKVELERKWQVFLKCWPQCLNVFLTFYVTLALFPTVLANTHKQKQNDYFSEKYFTPFSCFFIFNVFAMIGNLISSWTTWPGRDRVWFIVAIRLLFIPFFLFCNFNPESRHWPVLIENDIVFIIGNILLALSSGYLSSLCMMFASSNLTPDEAPKAGMLAAFFLVFGIFCGVNSSFLLTWIVELG